MLTALRQQLQQLLLHTPASRRPALRRSDRPDALFATDLPLLTEEDDLTASIAVAVQSDWRIGFLPNGWMTLDHDIPAPPLTIPPISQNEAGCCLSLLLQHPGGTVEKEYIRAIAKAADIGPVEVEKLCRIWHGDFSARLRQHQTLPDVLPYLCAAVCSSKEEKA